MLNSLQHVLMDFAEGGQYTSNSGLGYNRRHSTVTISKLKLRVISSLPIYLVCNVFSVSF